MFCNQQSRLCRPFMVLLIALLVAVFAPGCDDDDSPISGDEPTIIYSLYVDVATGDDANNGEEATPFKTITYALSIAVAHDSIKVAPGTYDLASGEVFPIYMPESVSLFGDVANRGVGTDTVRIEGVAEVSGGNFGTLVGGDGSVLTGFYVVQPSATLRYYCIVSDGVDFVMQDNTFWSDYGAVRLLGTGDPEVRDNTFETRYYGVYTNCSGIALIRDNDFTDGSYIDNQGGNPEIIANVFEGDAARAISVQNGSPLIEGNTMTGAYSLSALRIQYSGECKVRNNTFTVESGPCIQILGTTDPDLGTLPDPGGNVFAGNSGVAIVMESAAMVEAIGNTWYHATPLCGTEIDITGAGQVIYGGGLIDFCAEP